MLHVSITFLVNEQNMYRKQLKRGRLYLDSSFQGYNSSRQEGTAEEGLGTCAHGSLRLSLLTSLQNRKPGDPCWNRRKGLVIMSKACFLASYFLH